MPIQKKKKKKKEEFDASLMGGYVPGSSPVIRINPVGGIDKALTIPFWQNKWKYGSGDPYEPIAYEYEIPKSVKILDAWNQYAFGAGPSQLVAQTPQAYGLYRSGFYSSFRIALAFELGVATVVLATLYTILDPHRHWRAPFTEMMDPQFTNPQQVPEGMVRGGYL